MKKFILSALVFPVIVGFGYSTDTNQIAGPPSLDHVVAIDSEFENITVQETVVLQTDIFQLEDFVYLITETTNNVLVTEHGASPAVLTKNARELLADMQRQDIEYGHYNSWKAPIFDSSGGGASSINSFAEKGGLGQPTWLWNRCC